MSCQNLGGGVIVCGPPRRIVRRRLDHCDHCEATTCQVQHYSGLYYGDIITCVACGDSWSSEGRFGRPFRKGWRKEATARAREQWQNAISGDLFDEYVRADFDMYAAQTEAEEEAAVARMQEIRRRAAA